MRIPRDISGDDLAKLLSRYGFEITRHAGGHMRLTSAMQGQHRITIPRHANLKVGTPNSILGNVAEYPGVTKEAVVQELFSW